MSNKLLEIKDLHVNAEDKEILKGIDLTINKGEIHVIMGPNGSGKTTTANAILNNPAYTKTSGSIEFDGENINDLKTDEIARKGIFMSFQLPEEIPGITVTNFLKYAKNKITGQPVKIFKFKEDNREKISDIILIVLLVFVVALLIFVFVKVFKPGVVDATETERSEEELLAISDSRDDLEDIEHNEKSDSHLKIEEFIDANPEAAAHLLRNWLGEDWRF